MTGTTVGMTTIVTTITEEEMILDEEAEEITGDTGMRETFSKTETIGMRETGPKVETKERGLDQEIIIIRNQIMTMTGIEEAILETKLTNIEMIHTIGVILKVSVLLQIQSHREVQSDRG